MSDAPPVRRQPRQERARERVEAILDAAADVLRADGLAGLTTSAITARAEMSLPSLYRYFADREEVLVALAARSFDVLHELFDAQLAGLRTSEQAKAALADALHAYHDAFRSDPALAILWGGAVADPRLVALNAADSQRNGALLAQRIGPFSALDDEVLLRRCTLACHLTLATVSFALALPGDEGRAYVDEFGTWADDLLFGPGATPA